MPELPSTNVAEPVKPKTPDDILESFKELDQPSAEKSEKQAKPEPEPEEKPDIEDIEDEDLELKDPDEEIEKLDLEDKEADIDGPPRKKEILKAYPDLFKKFPFLEKMMYRDKQYNEMFGSFDDAKEMYENYTERAETWDGFEKDLLSGKTENLLKEVKDSDENAFKSIVDDYLTTLHKVDKDAYFHVVGNMNKRLIMEMVEEANRTENDDLKQAALLVNQFIFGSAKFTPPSRLAAEKSEAKTDEAEVERLAFVREQFENTRDDLQSRVDNSLRATISDYIDPKNQMSGYVKKNAVSDAMNMLSKAIAEDPSVVRNLDKLWRASFENKFSKDSQGKIQSYYLSQAKRHLKNVILKARAEALKDSTPSNSRETEEEPEERPTRRVATGRPSQPTRKNEMKKGESVTDFFMRD